MGSAPECGKFIDQAERVTCLIEGGSEALFVHAHEHKRLGEIANLVVKRKDAPEVPVVRMWHLEREHAVLFVTLFAHHGRGEDHAITLNQPHEKTRAIPDAILIAEIR